MKHKKHHNKVVVESCVATMVKLARIQTKSGQVILAARIAAKSFHSPEIPSSEDNNALR